MMYNYSAKDEYLYIINFSRKKRNKFAPICVKTLKGVTI